VHIIVYSEAVRSAILAKAWLLVTVKGTKNSTTINRLGDRQTDRVQHLIQPTRYRAA